MIPAVVWALAWLRSLSPRERDGLAVVCLVVAVNQVMDYFPLVPAIFTLVQTMTLFAVVIFYTACVKLRRLLKRSMDTVDQANAALQTASEALDCKNEELGAAYRTIDKQALRICGDLFRQHHWN